MMTITTRPDEVVSTWIGQDGCKWRELRCYVGSGFRSFTQREFAPGLWV